MEIELHPAVSLLPETLNVLVAPVEMLVDALNSHLELQRYKILFICGDYSPYPESSGSKLHGDGGASSLYILPANDHPGGKPPQLPDH